VEAISTELAPKAIGPYSQAIRSGNFLFCSGQIALDPVSGRIIAGGIREQTEQIMKNVSMILENQKLGFDRIIKTTVFLKNMDDFALFNETYASWLKAPYPSRSTVEVARLPKDVLVEIEVIAECG